ELNNLQTQLKRDLSYAELRNAYAQLYVSSGTDLLPDTLPDSKLATIASALQSSETHWAQ
ncbi:MAG: TolC family protein, partial [Pseudomonas sp.]